MEGTQESTHSMNVSWSQTGTRDFVGVWIHQTAQTSHFIVQEKNAKGYKPHKHWNVSFCAALFCIRTAFNVRIILFMNELQTSKCN